VNAAAPRSFALLACLVAALAAPPTHAAPTPEAIATKTFAARQKAARNAFRSALKAAETQAGIALRAVETGIASNGNLFAAGNATFAALRTFQTAVQNARDGAIAEQGNAAKDALASIGMPLAGHFPDSFYLDDGKPAALFQESLASDLAKSYVRIRKRVGRVRSRFEAADFGFSFRIRAPRPLEQRAWKEGLTLGAAGFQPTIDLLVAWSSVATDGDGQLRAAGSARTTPIDIGADNGTDLALEQDVVVFEERFSTDFSGDGFVEGGWLVTTSSAEPSELAIGIR
jgi:hypothetical protein